MSTRDMEASRKRAETETATTKRAVLCPIVSLLVRRRQLPIYRQPVVASAIEIPGPYIVPPYQSVCKGRGCLECTTLLLGVVAGMSAYQSDVNARLLIIRRPFRSQLPFRSKRVIIAGLTLN